MPPESSSDLLKLNTMLNRQEVNPMFENVLKAVKLPAHILTND